MAATKRGATKSDAVRELLSREPNAHAKDVVKALAKKGIHVTANLVYLVKGELKKAPGRRPAPPSFPIQYQALGSDASPPNGAHPNGAAAPLGPAETVRRVKGLATEVGGLDKLRELVDAISA